MSLTDFEIHGRFEPSAKGPASAGEPGWWFVFWGERILVHKLEDGNLAVPQLRGPDELAALGLAPARVQYLGTLEDTHCYCAEVEGEIAPPEGMSLKTLLALHGAVPHDLYVLAGRAVQIIDWDRKHQYCGRCGGTLVMRDSDERAKACVQCGLAHFPRLAPAIMALVERGDEVLLGRSPRFPEDFYSVLAGFVDPGETLEACVRREVHEEVNVAVDNIRYFGSQPWPFPHSLMIAFICDYAGGELRSDGEEIVDAGWYRADALPRVPGEISIAGKLIADFVRRKG